MVFKQKELDRDAELIKNRVGKLKQIEHKMLRKIDRTRVEADRVRQIKEKNNERLQERMRVIKEEQESLERKKHSIHIDKEVR